MTDTIDRPLAAGINPLPLPYDVVIVKQHDFADVALSALVEAFGHRVTMADATAPRLPACRVMIIRDTSKLAQVRRLAPTASIICIGTDVAPDSGITHLRDSADAVDLLREALAALCEIPAPVTERVHLSAREREVMTTYALGATIHQTARRHYISESTVRSHFRRVVARYTLAGRPVNNKSQLLVELIADGWIENPSADAAAG
ncbi:MAG: LuxR C-terminal-related transcriptional regulator [Gordonia amarae]